MSELRLFLSAEEKPFTDSDAASTKAEILSRELGAAFHVVPYGEGYAVVSEAPLASGRSQQSSACTPIPDIRMNPAWKSQWPSILISIAAFGMMLYGVQVYFRGSVFLPEMDTRTLSLILLLGGASLISYFCGNAAFYIYTNTYSYGPKGVSARRWVPLLDDTKKTIAYSKVQNIEYLQSNPMQMILGYGDVMLYTAGSDGEDLVFRDVSNPKEIKKHLDEYL